MDTKEDAGTAAVSGAWLGDYFRDAAEELDRFCALFEVTTDGIRAWIAATADGLPPAQAKRAAWARAEAAAGFPMLTTQHLADLWALLETQMRRFVARWLEAPRAPLRTDIAERLPRAVGSSPPRRERYHDVVRTLEREAVTATRHGVERFEYLLAWIGLAGALPPDVKRRLFELSKLRNCIVHNARIADESLRDECPWLDLDAGSPIVLGAAHVRELQRAVAAYLDIVMQRACLAGGERHPALPAIVADTRPRGEARSLRRRH